MTRLPALMALLAALLPAARAADLAAGQQLALQRCAACHGADGNSSAPMNPKLAGLNAAYLAKQIGDFQSGRRASPIMSAMTAGLTPDDIGHLAAWFATQRTARGANVERALQEQGFRIYRKGVAGLDVVACIDCHGPEAEGGSGPRLAGQHADYLLKQLQDFASQQRANDQVMGGIGGIELSMRYIAGKMSEAEMRAVAGFLSGL